MHTNDQSGIRDVLVKIFKAVAPAEQDLAGIIAAWGEQLTGPATLDALNIWLYTYLEKQKNIAATDTSLREIDALEPDPLPVDTRDVSG